MLHDTLPVIQGAVIDRDSLKNHQLSQHQQQPYKCKQSMHKLRNTMKRDWTLTNRPNEKGKGVYTN